MNPRLLFLAALLAQAPTSQEAFDAAKKLYDDGQWADALSAFQKFERDQKFSTALPQAIYFEGWCCFKLKRYQVAANVFDRLVKAYPDAPVVPEAILKLAECFRELGDFSKASDLYGEFQTKYPQHALLPQAMLGEAWARSKLGDLAGARAILQRIQGDEALIVLGEILMEAHNYDEARSVFQQVGTQSPRVLFRLGNCYQALGKVEEAGATYRDMLEKHPDDNLAEQAHFALIQTLTEQHQLEQASIEAEKFKRKYPKSLLLANVTYLQADAVFGREQYSDALNLYLKFRPSAKNPQVIETTEFRIGACYFGLKQFDKAQDALAQFLQKFPQSKTRPDALFRLGRTYIEVAPPKLSEAVKCFEQIRASYSNYDHLAEVTFQLGCLYTNGQAIATFTEFVQKWPDNQLVPEAVYQIARNQVGAQVVAAFRTYVEKYPDDVHVGDALYAIAQQCEADKKTDEAIAIYRDIVARTTGDAAIAAQLRLAALLEPKAAIPECESFLARSAGNRTAAQAVVPQLAQLYRKTGPLADAYAKLDQLAAEYPATRTTTMTSTIELALAEKDYERASTVALKLLADPDYDKLPPASYLAIGNALLKTERYSDARSVFEKVRTTPLGKLGLGQAYLGLKDFDQAEAIFKELVPQNLDAALGLGKVYEAKGNVTEAVAMFDPVWRQGRGDAAADAAFHVGMLAFKQKDYREALPMFARLLFATGPMAEEAAFRAAQCHEALRDVELARSAYQAYLRRFPSGSFVMEARTQLAKLPAPQT